MKSESWNGGYKLGGRGASRNRAKGAGVRSKKGVERGRGNGPRISGAIVCTTIREAPRRDGGSSSGTGKQPTRDLGAEGKRNEICDTHE